MTTAAAAHAPPTPQLPPKWILLTVTMGPLVIFVSTMTICIQITRKAGNIVWGRYRLHDTVLDNDISAYGIDEPAHTVFAIGFTVLSAVLSLIMYWRFLLWNVCLPSSQEDDRASSCCGCSFNRSVLITGWIHAPFLIAMGWTDGKFQQMVHFPSAIAGLGVLHVYCILNIILDAQVIRQAKNTRLPKCQQAVVGLEIVLLIVIAIFVPWNVVQWLSRAQSRREWMAVYLLLSSTLPAFLLFASSSPQRKKNSTEVLLQNEEPVQPPIVKQTDN